MSPRPRERQAKGPANVPLDQHQQYPLLEDDPRRLPASHASGTTDQPDE